MSSAHAAIKALTQQFSNIVIHQDRALFENYHQQIVCSSEYDELMGGLFDVDNEQQKTLYENVRLARVYVIAANIFADADYAKTALSTIQYLIYHHRTAQGYFCSHSHVSATAIEPEVLRSVLNPDQRLALTTYFGIDDSTLIRWHTLSRQMPVSALSEYTELHVKQAPLALDGGLQIMQQFITPPAQSEAVELAENIAFCHCLWLSATLLNQASHADVARELLAKITSDDLSSHAAAIEWLLLQRLSYEWDDEDYNLLKQLASNRLTIPSAVLFSHENGAEHISWSCEPTTESDHFFTPMLSMCETVVIIEGPAFIIRQWLQLTSNYFNPKLWVFAKPNDISVQASVYRDDGSVEIITDMNALVDLISQTYHPSTLPG
jgi:hypothetical protein